MGRDPQRLFQGPIPVDKVMFQGGQGMEAGQSDQCQREIPVHLSRSGMGIAQFHADQDSHAGGFSD